MWELTIIMGKALGHHVIKTILFISFDISHHLLDKQFNMEETLNNIFGGKKSLINTNIRKPLK